MSLKLLLFLIFLLGSARPAWAATVFQDHFDQSLHWKVVRNATHDDPSSPCLTPDGVPAWKIVDGTVEMNIHGSIPCSTEIIPIATAGENLRAFRMTVKMYISDPKMDRNLLLRWKDKDNYILFHFFGGGVSLVKRKDGRSAALENSNRGFAFQENRWYQMRVEYDLSLRSIKLFINDTLAMDAGEPTGEPQIEEGRPGLAASVGAVRYSFVQFDDFSVESLEATKTLGVPLVKQTDPRWKNTEYDSASEWAPALPTIGRWGCALSSGVSVLQFFGIKELPDGQTLNPETLNDWLRQQTDGYYPGGNINWRALSRLSAFHEKAFGTPALEMTYENPSDKIGWLKRKIDDGLPVILAQPGHFVTAAGYGPGMGDISLRDPFYDRFRLAEYGSTYVSARLFTPSHTDLSAVIVVVPLSTNVRFQGMSGKEIPINPVAEYPITDPLHVMSNKPFLIFDLPKPPEPITVVVESTLPIIPIWISTYSRSGDAAVMQRPVLDSPELAQFTIDTSGDRPNITSTRKTVQPVTLKELTLLFSHQSIRHPALVTQTLRYQDRLEQTSVLENALALERGYRLILQSAEKNGWLESQTAQALCGHFHELVLEKFP